MKFKGLDCIGYVANSVHTVVDDAIAQADFMIRLGQSIWESAVCNANRCDL